MKISGNTVASIHYTLKNSRGEILDSSVGAEPLEYLHGAGNIIPGLESELAGKSTGDKLEVKVEPKLAYGERHDEMVQNVPIAHFEGIEDLQVGMRFRAQSDIGEQLITIVGIQDNEVTVDGNHPLAGETLYFSVEVVGLREATATEIEHGHIHHGGCGHNH
ncbi:MAG: peptidylprolyl isomerase [Gammaproteobacteria bacterium]|nr:peptidylprolyl isomerase [Gammaproteobacteria bacterium]